MTPRTLRIAALVALASGLAGCVEDGRSLVVRTSNVSGHDLFMSFFITGSDEMGGPIHTFLLPPGETVETSDRLELEEPLNVSGGWTWHEPSKMFATGNLRTRVDPGLCPSVTRIVVAFVVDGVDPSPDPKENDCPG